MTVCKHGACQNNFLTNSIALTGGGTAGHIWPHFALFEGETSSLAQAFRDHKLNVYYIGSKEGMEKDLVSSTQPSWIYCPIATGKLRRYFSVRNFLDPFFILLGFVQAFFLLKKIKPGVLFSKGGFVSAPVVWAAWLCRIPIVIHESDATPALATKLTLPFCSLALFAFSEAIKKIHHCYHNKSIAIGLPIRESLFTATKEEGLKYFSFSAARKTLLIFGGSLGARGLNKKIYEVLPELLKDYNIIHIVGKGNKSEHGAVTSPSGAALSSPGLTGGATYYQCEFLKDDMRYAYAAADLAICRAGASSIFELAAARIPMLLVPLGLNASRGDQIINARIFVNHGWAECVDENTLQKDVTLKIITQAIHSLADRKKALDTAPSSSATSLISEVIYNISQHGFKDFSDTVASFLKPGDWLFLDGDLGSGKTTLTQKISFSLGAQGVATSPTFSILNVENLHKEGSAITKLLHLDLYRIKSGRELCFLGLESEFNSLTTLCIFEWPYNVEDSEFESLFKVTGCSKPGRILEIKIDFSKNLSSRIYSFRYRNNFI